MQKRCSCTVSLPNPRTTVVRATDAGCHFHGYQHKNGSCACEDNWEGQRLDSSEFDGHYCLEAIVGSESAFVGAEDSVTSPEACVDACNGTTGCKFASWREGEGEGNEGECLLSAHCTLIASNEDEDSVCVSLRSEEPAKGWRALSSEHLPVVPRCTDAVWTAVRV